MRHPGLSKRRGLLLLALAAAVVVLFVPVAGADTLSNISPSSSLAAGGWMGRYPISHYQLDQYFPAISVSLFGGINVSGLMPMVAYAAAQVIWLVLAFISDTVITVFQFAFNLNLLTGEGGGGGGALAPITRSIHNVYTHTFGRPWLIAAVAAVAIWGMWKALVQRRYTQTATALATSLIYCVIALGIVANPAQTITPLSNLSNEISRAFLSLTSNGNVSEGSEAEQESTGQLFQTLVVNPWTVLEFGGIEHCVNTQGHSTPVQPISRNSSENTKLAGELEDTSEVAAEGKRCINNREKYAPHFLAYSYQSPGRNAEYQALKAGATSKLPSSDPAKNNGSYPLGAADKPAAEASGKGGQYERLLIALLLVPSELGIWLLLGALCAGVILAQVLLLLWLWFAPAALIAAVFPGRGHAFFTGWVQRLLGYLARKAIYSLILASLLSICQALQVATSGLGWLMSFLLEAIFCWWVLIQRHQLTSIFTHTLTGSAASGDQELGQVKHLVEAGVLAQLAGLRGAKEGSVGTSGKQPAGAKTPVKPAPASTPSSVGSRPATAAATSQSSRKAASTPVGATARNLGVSTSTAPPSTGADGGTPAARRSGEPPRPGEQRAGGSPVDAAGGGRQRPGQLTPSSRAARPGAVSASSQRGSRPAASTPSMRRLPRKATVRTASSQPQRPAPQTATPLPAPGDFRRPAAQPPQTLPAKTTAALERSTATSGQSKPASKTTTTPAPRQAGGPKET